MGKVVKGTIAVVALLILIVSFAAYYVLDNLDRLVQAAIEKTGTQVTGTAVLVDDVAIELRDGRGEIRGLTIGNPPGYQSSHALRIGRLALAIDTATITADPIRISAITVEDTDLIAELGAGGMNLRRLLANMESDGDTARGAPDESSAAGPGLVIERFEFTGATLTLDTPLKDYATSVPDVRLSGIGEKDQGATASEAARQILEPVIAAAVEAAQREAGAQGLDGWRDGVFQRAREKAGEALDKLRDRLGPGD